MNDDDPRLDALVAAVARAQKYRDLAPDLVQRVGAAELAHRHSLADAVKATKRKLHQVAAVYLTAPTNYDEALRSLRRAANKGTESLRAACREAMAGHVSTRERLPDLEHFYAEALAGLAPSVVIDVGCGFNPLAIPWMPLGPQPQYFAYDAYIGLAGFLRQCLPLLGVEGNAYARDIVAAPPTERADVALVLKSLPCLEQQGRGAGLRLLDALDARYLLVSFPVRSIGGRSKGMQEHYEEAFLAMAKDRPWRLRRMAFSTELAFLVEKGAATDA